MTSLRLHCLALLLLIAPILAAAQTPPAPPVRPAAEAGFSDGYADGVKTARMYSTTDSWFGGGLVCGISGGILGVGALAAVSRIGTAEPPGPVQSRVAAQSFSFQQGFKQGYNDRTKLAAAKAIVIGGLIGSAVGLSFYLSTQ